MEIFTYTAKGVLPVFFVIFIGILLNKLKFFSENTKSEIIKLVFYVGTPSLIFLNVATTDIYKTFDLKYLLFVVGAILVFIGILIFSLFFIKDKKKKGAVIQIAYRSNFAIVGMPLAMSLLGKNGVALTAVTLSFVIITYNITAVILLSYYGNAKSDVKNVIKGIIKNPLIIGTLLGLLFALFKIPLYEIPKKTISYFGDIASSMGLIIIGASISLNNFQKNKNYILLSVFLRNIIAPIYFLSMGILFGFRNDYLTVLAIMSAAPAAVNCFVMADQMGVDSDISAFGVSFTSLASIVSIFACIYLLKITGLA